MLQSLYILFFFSGVSSLIFETVFTRLLTYTFGNTAYAVSTVLAAFLGGLALGAYLVGRWVDRRPPSLLVYGGLELLVGIYGLFIPRLFALMTDSYVSLFHRLHFGAATLTAVRFGLAALVILVPTLLMGGTLPALARYVSSGCAEFQVEVDRLYAWNTTGAAAGVLASTFLLTPVWGVAWTIRIACAINFLIFAAIVSRRKRALELPPAAPDLTGDRSSDERPASRQVAAVLLFGSFLTGGGSRVRGPLDACLGVYSRQQCLRVWDDAVRDAVRFGVGRANCLPAFHKPGGLGAGAGHFTGRTESRRLPHRPPLGPNSRLF